MSITPVGLPVTSVAPVLPVDGLASAGVAPAAGEGFGAALARGLDQVQQMQANTDKLAVQAATGDLRDVHDYMIASTESSLATELTVAVRNKAVEAFNEIMRMPI